MEIIVTLAYFFLVRLVFFDYKWLRFNLFWKFVVFGIYIGAAMTEIIALGQYTPYSKELLVESRVLQIAPEYGGIVKEVQAKANVPLKKGDPLFLMDPAPRQAKVDEIRAQLAEADYELAYSRLLAPFDALILSVEVNPGQSINNALQSKTLVTLVRQGYYVAEFYVPVDSLDKFKVGQTVTVTLEGKPNPGVVSSISYEPLQASGDNAKLNAGLFMIQAGFTAVDNAMHIGRKAKVHID
jgi:multidrug resistance efflux pump